MKRQEKSPHRLAHQETSSCMPVELRTMAKGDVFVRQGAPHMMVELDSSTRAAVDKHHSVGDALYVINLQTGSVWPASAKDQVYPATNVVLSYQSARRGEVS